MNTPITSRHRYAPLVVLIMVIIGLALSIAGALVGIVLAVRELLR